MKDIYIAEKINADGPQHPNHAAGRTKKQRAREIPDPLDILNV
jgi:hypothetical protein